MHSTKQRWTNEEGDGGKRESTLSTVERRRKQRRKKTLASFSTADWIWKPGMKENLPLVLLVFS